MTSDPELDPYLPPEYQPNVIVVMAKSRSPGIWRAAGGAISAEELGIPPELAGRLGHWSRDLAALITDMAAPQRTERLRQLAAEGLAFARQVQATIGPEFVVLYFDEAKLEAEAAFTEYLYPAGTA